MPHNRRRLRPPQRSRRRRRRANGRLRVEDLGPDYVTIVQTKNGKTRRVPLTPELRAELVAHAHKSGYVFGEGKSG